MLILVIPPEPTLAVTRMERARRTVVRMPSVAGKPGERVRSPGSVLGCYGRNASCLAPPVQIRTWSLDHPAPTSGR